MTTVCTAEENLARSNDVTCTASANLMDCDKVFDGIYETNNVAFKWDFFGPASNQWIRIYFPRDELVGSLRIMENLDHKSLKDIELRFSDGSTQQVWKEYLNMLKSTQTISMHSSNFMSLKLNNFFADYLSESGNWFRLGNVSAASSENEICAADNEEWL